MSSFSICFNFNLNFIQNYPIYPQKKAWWAGIWPLPVCRSIGQTWYSAEICGYFICPLLASHEPSAFLKGPPNLSEVNVTPAVKWIKIKHLESGRDVDDEAACCCGAGC